MNFKALSLKALILAPLFVSATAQAALFKLEPYGYISCSNADQSQRIVIMRTHGREQTLTLREDTGRVSTFDLDFVRLKVTRSMILSVQVTPPNEEAGEIGSTTQAIAAEIEVSVQGLPKTKSSFICEKTTLQDLT